MNSKSGLSRNNGPSKSMDSSMIKEFFEFQKDKISLEQSELELKKQHIKNQSELAKQSLVIQEKLLTREPEQIRKNRSQIFGFSILALVVVLAFSAFCLAYDHVDFLKYLVGAITHIFAIAMGYFFGQKKSERGSNITDIDDAEVVD